MTWMVGWSSLAADADDAATAAAAADSTACCANADEPRSRHSYLRGVILFLFKNVQWINPIQYPIKVSNLTSMDNFRSKTSNGHAVVNAVGKRGAAAARRPHGMACTPPPTTRTNDVCVERRM